MLLEPVGKAVDTLPGVRTITSTVIAAIVFFTILTGYVYRSSAYLGMIEVKQYKQFVC